MTEEQLRVWARGTLRKYGEDCLRFGQRGRSFTPNVKEQELLGFMNALIDKIMLNAESTETAVLRAYVKREGGSFPRVP